jgi:hypothetical protein
MVSFDTKAWKSNRLAYLIIIIIVIIILVLASKGISKERKGRGLSDRRHVDGNGTAYYQGRGCLEDSVPELLDRIDWAAYVEKRTTLWFRTVILTVVATALVVVLVMKKLPKPPALVMLIVAIFIPFYAGHQLHYVHGDVYNDYYIKRNVELLRKKLNLKKGKVKDPKCEAPKRALVMNPK